MVADAEAIKVISEIMEQFPPLEFGGHWMIRINHAQLISCLLDSCGINDAKVRQQILDIIMVCPH